MNVTLGKLKNRKSFKVHRIVAILFVSGFQPELEVNHKNFIRHDNRAQNLEWVTHTENIQKSQQANRLSGKRTNENNGRQKLKTFEVIEIRKLYKEGKQILSISKKYNIGWTTVKHIVDFDTWVSI